MLTFDLLPQELVEEVASYGDLEDLRAVRLACRQLCIKTTYSFRSKYFQNVQVTLSPHSVGALQDIAGCEDLRQHVQEITINPQLMAASKTKWSRNNIYKEQTTDREVFQDQGYDNRILSAVFSSLPKLEWIHAGPWHQQTYDPCFRPSLSITANNWSTIRLLHHAVGDTKKPKNIYRDLGVVFKALRAANINRPILDLHLCARDPKGGYVGDGPFNANGTDWLHVKPLLRALHLGLLVWYERFGNYQWLRQFLKSLPPTIEEITIEKNINGGHDGQGWIDSFQVLDKVSLPNLKRLVVDHFLAFNEVALINFLKSVSPSLETLVLSRLKCYSAHFNDYNAIFKVLIGMHSLKELHLSELHISRQYGSNVPVFDVVHNCGLEYSLSTHEKHDDLPQTDVDMVWCREGRAVDLYGQEEIQTELAYAIAHVQWHKTWSDTKHPDGHAFWFRTVPGKPIQKEGHDIYKGERPVWMER